MASDIKVGLLLHFYQPWWQFPHVLTKIVDECYRPIFQWVDARPGFAFSANINWSLLELLERHGYNDIIELMRRAVDGGKIELFGTAAHHPILPLLSSTEIQRQIDFDHDRKLAIGFPAKTCTGAYLPEYAFNQKVVRPLKRAGFTFTIADDALFASQHTHVPFDRIPHADGLAVFLRSRRWGNAISFGEYDFDRFDREFTQGVGQWFGGKAGHVVLATDAETFGHHHRTHIDWLLKPMVECWSRPDSPVDILPFQQLMNIFGLNSCETPVPPGSWSTEAYDFVSGNHFPLWDSPDNVYHKALWKLVNVARKYGDRPDVLEDILKMLSSCSWWQVSGRPNFNPPLMMCGARKAMDIIERLGDTRALEDGHKAFENLVKLPGINR